MDEIWAEFLKHERAYSTLITTTANWFLERTRGDRESVREREREMDR